MNCVSLNSQSLSCILSQVSLSLSLSLSLKVIKEQFHYLHQIHFDAKFQFLLFANCKQAREILGISPDKICQGARSDISVDPQSSNRLSHQSVLSSLPFDEFASEAKRSISEDEDIDCKFILPRIDIPKWFSHHSVGHSISFWVGPRFPKFAFCIAFGPEAQRGGFVCQVYLKINGCKISINVFPRKEVCDHLWLFSKSHRELQKQLNDSNPSKLNHVEVVCNLDSPDGGESLPTFIKGCGVHVKCTCHP